MLTLPIIFLPGKTGIVAMTQIIIIFGILTCLSGLVMLINPELVLGWLRKHYEKVLLHVLAVVIRLILGGLMIYQADASKYPLTIEIIGWLSIIAAITFALIGRARFCRLMGWALSQAKTTGRFGGIIAAAFGMFLVHSFI